MTLDDDTRSDPSSPCQDQMPKASTTVAEVVAAALQRHGVTHLFAQSLPSAVVLAAERIGIRQVAYRQENMGGAMADGYARISGKVGVMAAQNGPAAALLVAPLAEALKASIAVVALVQEVERDQTDRNAFQELDHLRLFDGCAKWVRRLTTPGRVDDYVDAAFTAAASGRPGPAVLLLPADLLREPAALPARVRTANLGTWPLDEVLPSDEAVTAAATLIAEARNPVVMAGGGALAGNGPLALTKLRDIASLPVFTTNMGKGAVDEFHPLSCGVMGALVGPISLGRYTGTLLRDADLILQIGTRNNQNGTDSWRNVPEGARIVQIDVDPQEIGRNYEAVRLVGTAAATMRALTEALVTQNLTHRTNARAGLEKMIANAWRDFEAARANLYSSDATPVRPERVMAALQRLLTPETIVAADASYASMWVVGQLRGKAPGMRFITPRGLAGLGWGLPLATGAKLAHPEAPIVALVGDGGFAHSWAELETLVRMDIPVTTIVLNNGVLGYQKDAETVKFGAYSSACHFAPIDHAAIARACGCRAIQIDDPTQLEQRLASALASTDPWLIDVATDPSAHPALSLFDGILDK